MSKVATKAKYRLVDFVRPSCGYWPTPYTLEQAFGVFRWMIVTGKEYHQPTTWGRSSVDCLLSCKPTCVGFSDVDPITSIDDLQRRFQYALLYDVANGGSMARWRKENGVTLDSARVISFPHHPWHTTEISEHEFKCSVRALFGARGRLGVQLNKYHSRAREICRVELHCRSTYRFILRYGYQGSEWSHVLATQTPSMTFAATVERASRELNRMIDGKEASESP